MSHMTESAQPGSPARNGPPAYATFRVARGHTEHIEGFLDMEQAALWALAHMHDGTYDSVIPEPRESLDAVKQALGDDALALARFFVRCGHDDDTVVHELAATRVDVVPTIRAARDELALMAEYDEA